MEFNSEKNHLIVFKMGGPLIKYKKWMYNRNTLETENAYKYLGLMLSTKLVWTKTCKILSEQANKALYPIKSLIRRYNIVIGDVFYILY